MKKSKINLILKIIISIFCFLLICELFVRGVVYIGLLSDKKDLRYGWKSDQYTSKIFEIKDNSTSKRMINFTLTKNGFKRYGQITGEKKIFIVGDSFTKMMYVNNGEEWYSNLEREYTDYDFFVFGEGGYGTYQEYLLIDEYIDEINPDILIIQFSHNDFYNNHFIIDKSEYPFNVPMQRPYYINESSMYVFPGPAIFGVREKWITLDKVLDIYEKMMKKKFYNQYYSKETDIEKVRKEMTKNFEYNMIESYEITRQIFEKIAIRTNAEIIFFSVDNFTKYEYKLCENIEMKCIWGVGENLSKYSEVNVINDGHWNKKGNKIAGEFLVKNIKLD